jgi:protein TonB
MRKRALLLSLLIHGLFLALALPWLSLASRQERREVVVPIELDFSSPLPPPPKPGKGKVKAPAKAEPKKRREVKKKKNAKPAKKRKTLKKRAPVKRIKRVKEVVEKVKRNLKKEEEKAKGPTKAVKPPERESKKGASATPPFKGELEKEAKSPPSKEPLPLSKSFKEEKREPEFELESYKALVISALRKNKFYPPLARRLGIEGKVLVEIEVNRKGELLSVRALSGNRVLKRGALKLVKRSKLPPLPSSFRGDKLRFRVEIVYKLNEPDF